MRKIIIAAWNSPTVTSWFKMSSLSLRGVLVTPLILTTMSAPMITVYYIINTIISLVPNFTAPFAGTYLRAFSYAFAGAKTYGHDSIIVSEKDSQPNYLLLKNLYLCSNNIQIIVVFLTLVIVFLCGCNILNDHLIRMNRSDEIWVAFLMIVFSIGAKVWLDRNIALIHAAGLVAVLNRWESLTSLFVITGSAIILKFDGHVFSIAFGCLITGLSALFYTSKLLQPNVRNNTSTSFKSYNKELGARLLTPAIKECLISVLSTGINRIAGLIAVFFIFDDNLAKYLNAYSMVMIATNISTAPFYTKNPEFAKLRATGAERQLEVETGKAILTSLFVFALTVSVMGATLPIFYDLINSNIEFIDNKTWVLMCLSAFLLRHEGMQAQVVMTTGKVPFLRMQIITGFLKLGLTFIGLKFMGIFGLVLAQFSSHFLILNWYIPKTSWRSFSDNGKSQRREYFLYSLVLFISLFFILYLFPDLLWVFYENLISMYWNFVR